MSKPLVERKKIFCKNCNKEIKHNPRETNTKHNNRVYCSYKCQVKKISKQCKFCNKTYKVHLCRKLTNNFCSMECRNKYYATYYVGENSSNWAGGKSFEDYNLSFNKKLKSNIRKRDNFTCQVCGLVGVKPALDVHHIDYDKNNSNENNLISLCHSCHSKIPNQSKKWREYFENKNR